MFEHYPDMNHDGEKDSRDAALLDEILREEKHANPKPTSPKRKSSAPLYGNYGGIKRINLGNRSYPAGEFLFALVTLFASIILLMVIFSASINSFTAILALIALIAGIFALAYIFD